MKTKAANDNTSVYQGTRGDVFMQFVGAVVLTLTITFVVVVLDFLGLDWIERLVGFAVTMVALFGAYWFVMKPKPRRPLHSG